jgi:hypothetical protein
MSAVNGSSRTLNKDLHRIRQWRTTGRLSVDPSALRQQSEHEVRLALRQMWNSAIREAYAAMRQGRPPRRPPV